MRPVIDPADVADDVTVVVRTDYSDETAWRAVVAALRTPTPDGDVDEHHFVDDPRWEGADVEAVLAALPPLVSVVFIADEQAMREPFPLLAVDAADDVPPPDRQFRVLPAGVFDVSVNVSIANMDFVEFAESARADPAGWYRGAGAAREQSEPVRWDGWSPCDGHRLRRGQTLRDAHLTSPNGRYALRCHDGRLTLTQDGEAVWLPVGMPSGTGVELSQDGELQYRSPTGQAWPLIPDFDHLRGRRPRWPKDEGGRPAPAVGAHALLVRDDGDVDLVDERDRTMWSFGTAHHVRLLNEFRAMAITRPADGSEAVPPA